MNPPDMRSRPRHPDDRTTDRLLAGVIDPADAPPGFAGTARLLGRAADEFVPVHADATLVAALAHAITANPTTPRRKSMLTQLLTAKVAAAAAAVVLSATTAAAATGTLPEPAQGVAADAAAQVGINIPNPSEDHPTGTADNPTEADEHGDTVSGTARDTETTGADKGAEISTTARGEHGQAPATAGTEDAPAPVDTPNAGGTGTAGTASDGVSDAGTANAPQQADDGSANASEHPTDQP